MIILPLLSLMLSATPPRVLVDESVPVDEVRRVWPDASVTVVRAAIPNDAAVEAARTSCAQARDSAMSLARQSSSMFAQARDAYVQAFPYVASFGEITQCLLDHAAYEIESGSAKVGAELLAEYLTIGGAPPDPAAYSPRVLNVMKNKQQKRGETLAFSVSTVPAGAEIWMDGKRIDGQTPLTIASLPAGWHWLLVKKDYYRPFASRVFVTPTNAAIAARLEPLSPEAECLLHIEEKERACPGYSAVLATRVARLAVRTHDHGRVSVRFFASVGEIHETTPGNVSSPASAPSSSNKPVVLTLPAPTAAPVHPALAILPFGIGQFAEKRYGVGAFFLASQVLLLALQTTTFAMAFQGRTPDGRYVDVASARRAQTLQIVNLVAVGALGADVIAGAIDGLVHRRPK